MGVLTRTDLEFVRMREHEGGVHSFAFAPLRRFSHAAGQHGFLKLPGVALFKPFSLASAPEDPEVLIGTRLQSNSTFKTALAALKPGQRASMRGPVMNFTLDESSQDVVLLAQGVGITPFRSLLRHIKLAGRKHRTTLIHVGQGHAFRSDTESLATSATYPVDRETFHVNVNETATERPTATYFISGAGDFLTETAGVLSELGISKKQMKKDRFLGY